jgi:hypothetical protein
LAKEFQFVAVAMLKLFYSIEFAKRCLLENQRAATGFAAGFYPA